MVLASPFTIAFCFDLMSLSLKAGVTGCIQLNLTGHTARVVVMAQCSKRQKLCWPGIVPESSGLRDGVSKEHNIWFENAATLSTRWEVEVFASALQLHITIRPSDWNVDFPIWLHDHISLLKHQVHCCENGGIVCTQLPTIAEMPLAARMSSSHCHSQSEVEHNCPKLTSI